MKNWSNPEMLELNADMTEAGRRGKGSDGFVYDASALFGDEPGTDLMLGMSGGKPYDLPIVSRPK